MSFVGSREKAISLSKSVNLNSRFPNGFFGVSSNADNLEAKCRYAEILEALDKNDLPY